MSSDGKPCVEEVLRGIFKAQFWRISSPGSLNQDNEYVNDEKCSREMFGQGEMSRVSPKKYSP
jgi:hypothetical protein